MKPKVLQRVFVLTIGVLLVAAVQAMPPAPQGPYQSIEDDFNRAKNSAQIDQQRVQPHANMRQFTPPPVNRPTNPDSRPMPQRQGSMIKPRTHSYHPEPRGSQYPGYPQDMRSQY